MCSSDLLIGVTGQYASVDEMLTGAENLRLFGRLLRLGRRRARERADELLAAFSLTGAGGKRVSGYSGGMRRRLDLAVSLIARPPLIFLDEPTTGLDPRTREQMWEPLYPVQAQPQEYLFVLEFCRILKFGLLKMRRLHPVFQAQPSLDRKSVV